MTPFCLQRGRGVLQQGPEGNCASGQHKEVPGLGKSACWKKMLDDIRQGGKQDRKAEERKPGEIHFSLSICQNCLIHALLSTPVNPASSP